MIYIKNFFKFMFEDVPEGFILLIKSIIACFFFPLSFYYIKQCFAAFKKKPNTFLNRLICIICILLNIFIILYSITVISVLLYLL